MLDMKIKTVNVDGIPRSVSDDKGKLLGGGDSDSLQAFWRWADETVATDRAGRPLTLYHGTNKEFSEFRNRYAGKGWEMFSTDPHYSNVFANDLGGNVIAVYLSMQNPLDLSHISPKGPAVRDQLIRTLEDAEIKFKIRDIPVELELFQMVNLAGHHTDLAEALQEAGFDGIIMPDILENRSPPGSSSEHIFAKTYIVFRPEQIKSAIGNPGSYCKNSPCVTDGHGPKLGVKIKGEGCEDSVLKASAEIALSLIDRVEKDVSRPILFSNP